MLVNAFISWSEMEWEKNDVTYILLLKLAILQHDLSSARKIWKECIDHLVLNSITLRKFIWPFTSLRDIALAYVALQQMVVVASQCKFSTTTTYQERVFDSRLDVRILLSIPDLKLMRWSLGDIIFTCASSRSLIIVEQLMLQMQNLGLEPSCGTYNGFKLLKVWQQKNMKSYDLILATLSVSYSWSLALGLAAMFLGPTSKCNHIYPFNGFLKAHATLGAVSKDEMDDELLSELRLSKAMGVTDDKQNELDSLAAEADVWGQIFPKAKAPLVVAKANLADLALLVGTVLDERIQTRNNAT